MDSVLEAIASFASAIRPESLDPGAVKAAKRSIIDAIGCSLAAFTAEPVVLSRRLASAAPLPGGATVLGTAIRSSPDMAAFVNGLMVRYLDFNDSYVSAGGIGHPSDYIPAVLVAAEGCGASGKQTLAAVVCAYEVFNRMTDAANLIDTKFDHTTNGATAAAAGAACVMGLDPERIRHAISIAVVANVTLLESRRGQVSMWKGCASANAGRNGLFAALLAREGLSGPGSPFTGVGGFAAAVSGALEAPVFKTEGDTIFKSVYKRYPAGVIAQTAIEAALELGPLLVDQSQVAAIELGTFPLAKRGLAGDPQKWNPQTRETADHSLPYLTASTLIRGATGLADFEHASFRDPAVLALMAKLTVVVDPECTAAFPEAMLTRLTATMKDGTTHRVAVGHHRGHYRNAMTDAELEQKFRDLIQPALESPAIEALLARLWSLDELETIAPVFELSRIDAARAAPEH